METVRPLLALLLLYLAVSQASFASVILHQLQQHSEGSAEAMYCSPLYLNASSAMAVLHTIMHRSNEVFDTIDSIHQRVASTGCIQQGKQLLTAMQSQ
jgi:hypothetical protein